MLYVYGGSTWDTSVVEQGDFVKVEGIIGTYYNNRELKCSNLTVLLNLSIAYPASCPLTKDNVKEFVDGGHNPCAIVSCSYRFLYN